MPGGAVSPGDEDNEKNGGMMRKTTVRWKCDAVQPLMYGYETHFYSSARPPIEADEYDRMCAEAADLRRQLAEMTDECLRIQVDNAKLRFYVVELEAASRTIDMHLAQQAAQEKYEAAFGDQAAEGRPIAVDRPGQPLCQLPEGHDGPHDHVCETCNGTGELDNAPVDMRCPICHGSGRRQL